MGPETRHYEGSVLMRFGGAVSGALEAVLEAVLGPVALRCFMEKMHAPVCALFLSFRPPVGASFHTLHGFLKGECSFM